jgi:TrmH family RNA methyltransferase
VSHPDPAMGSGFPVLGRHSPRLKRLRELDTPAGRSREGCFLLEGVRVLAEAMEGGLVLQWLLVAQGASREAVDLAARAARTGVEVCLLDAEVLERLAPTRSSQGLLGVARIPGTDLQQVLRGNPVVLLEGIQDPGNTGTLLRTARAAGAGGAILVGGADPFNPRAVRAASGATFRLPLVRLDPQQAPMLLQALDQAGFDLACAEAHGGQDLYQASFPKRMALVLGGEVRGVSEACRRAAVARWTIPLEGDCESLNVAAAAAVILFEARRRRLHAAGMEGPGT